VKAKLGRVNRVGKSWFVLVALGVLYTAQVSAFQARSCAELVGVFESIKRDGFEYQLTEKRTVRLPGMFRISAEQVARQSARVDRAFIEESLFVVPTNDGEAVRILQILDAVKAPFVKVGRQNHGGRLQDEGWPSNRNQLNKTLRKVRQQRLGTEHDVELPDVKRIVVIEIPGISKKGEAYEKSFEEKYGLEIVPVDHHSYEGVDRYNPLSSLEQFASLIGWQMSRVDQMIAINDRSYIPGLRHAGFTSLEIRYTQVYSAICAGLKPADILNGTRQVVEFLNQQRITSEFIVFRDIKIDMTLLKQEIAMGSEQGFGNVLSIMRGNSLFFSGAPEAVIAIRGIDWQAHGYAPGTVKVSSGGDPRFSQYIGLKFIAPPEGHSRKLPEPVIDNVISIIYVVVEGLYSQLAN
jgi:hypothetical protein